MDLELDLERQVLQPGDEVVGQARLRDPSIEKLELVLQGEEVLGANDVARTLITPVVEERLELVREPQHRVDSADQSEEERAAGPMWVIPFRFTLPSDAPPSYASRDIRCRYSLKATVRRGFLRRPTIRKMHLTVLPRAEEGLQALPVELEVDHPSLRLVARLNSTLVLTGESLEGSLLLERKVDGAPLPKGLSFRLAAIERSLDKFFPHRHVLTLDTHDIDIDQELQLPLVGHFEFPLHEAAEPSGEWNSFVVEYGFRVVMYDHDGKDYRRSFQIDVFRDLRLRRDYVFEGHKAVLVPRSPSPE